MKPIHAVFEKGVFRPMEKVDLAEHTKVEFELRVTSRAGDSDAALDSIYETLSRRYRSGECDVAARHNEHQP